jgi:hypothetical protein
LLREDSLSGLTFNSMAKSKYDAETFPQLAEGFARMGMIDTEIAAALSISHDTLYRYQHKYPEFSEAMKRGKFPANIQVEAAALKRAIGFEYDEVMEETERNPKTGRMVVTKRRKTRKFIPPDTAAFIYWLNNRDPDRWKSLRHQEVRSEHKSVWEIVKQLALEEEDFEDAEVME